MDDDKERGRESAMRLEEDGGRSAADFTRSREMNDRFENEAVERKKAKKRK